MDISQQIEQSLTSARNGEIYRSIIGNAEKLLFEKTLEKTRGNQVLAARILGVNRNTLRAKIKRFNIDIESFKE